MSFIRLQGPPTVVSTGLRPVEGPRAAVFVATIIGAEPAVAVVDMKALNLSCIQTVFVDNSANAMPATVELMPTGQVISVQANTQGFFPALLPLTLLNVRVSYAGDATITLRFINVTMDPFIYSATPPVITVTGTVSTIPTATTAVTQSGAWNVGVIGTLPAFAAPPAVAQSGAWSVGQSGAWSVGQVGTWIVEPPARSTSYNLAGNAVIKAAAGRLFTACVNTAAAGTALHDCAAVGAAAAGNLIAILPNAVGPVYFNDWNFSTGLVILPAVGSVTSLSWS